MHKDWNNEKILEIGMGTGRFTQVLAERGAFVSAIDTSQSMIEITKNKLEKKGLNEKVQLFNASAFELPFKNSYFDGCISINVFSHLQNYERVIMEISRILKPGGFFIVNFPNLLSYFLPYGILVNLNRKSLRRNVFTHWYNLFAIRDIYFKSGLKIVEIQGQAHLPAIKNSEVFRKVIKLINSVSRTSILKYICPVIFVKGIKKEEP